MSLYQKIKSAITVRQVGEMYGMEPDRHGMVCCPFHSDSDPSMKLNDTYYYCFGCGANGDAIDLTAKLFDLNPRQAAEKLIHDFGLDPDIPERMEPSAMIPFASFTRELSHHQFRTFRCFLENGWNLNVCLLIFLIRPVLSGSCIQSFNKSIICLLFCCKIHML